jgi:hypothetical protein
MGFRSKKAGGSFSSLASAFLASALAALLVLLPATAHGHEATSFEAEVKPILRKSCGGTNCHINSVQSGVDLTTFQKVMGSVGLQYGGPIVIPGDPDQSPLIDKVSGNPPRFGVKMPFVGAGLTEEEILTLRKWIQGGALDAHLPLRGDSNNDDNLNITDAVVILNFLFLGTSQPACEVLADSNADTTVNLTDAVFILNFLFLGGPSPVRLTDAEFDSCQQKGELSFGSIYEKVLAASCAFASCHSAESHRAGLSFATLDDAYKALVGAAPTTPAALAAGYLLVEPGKPEKSFLVKKLTSPGPGEGNRMPASSSTPLSVDVINGIREWILAGAPKEGTISGVPDITDEPAPPTDRIPAPPPPEEGKGIQIHLGPFPVAPRSEREIFYYLDKPLASFPQDVLVQRMDIHMSDDSHHFILYEYTGSTKPPAGYRTGAFVNLTSHRFLAASQQAFFSLAFPPGVGFKISKNASFDLNSHYLNLNGSQTLQAEVYVNIFFAEPGSVTTFVKPVFDINTNINVPPHQTVTTKLAFPSASSSLQDLALGSNGRVSRETHIYALSSHMHRHGIKFVVYLIENGRDTAPPQKVYENDDWDDPVYKTFDPPLILKPGQGLRYETTHSYFDPPSENAPPLQFAETSEDEMAIMLGMYAIKN